MEQTKKQTSRKQRPGVITVERGLLDRREGSCVGASFIFARSVGKGGVRWRRGQRREGKGAASEKKR